MFLICMKAYGCAHLCNSNWTASNNRRLRGKARRAWLPEKPLQIRGRRRIPLLPLSQSPPTSQCLARTALRLWQCKARPLCLREAERRRRRVNAVSLSRHLCGRFCFYCTDLHRTRLWLHCSKLTHSFAFLCPLTCRAPSSRLPPTCSTPDITCRHLSPGDHHPPNWLCRLTLRACTSRREGFAARCKPSSVSSLVTVQSVKHVCLSHTQPTNSHRNMFLR